MSTLSIRTIDITKLHTDAIVNAANTSLLAGSGVCGAIFQAAGYDKLSKACDAIGNCATGEAVIMPGFALPARYIIHAVGPIYQDGQHDEPRLLRSAYTHSLLLAKQYDCHSIGFPLISAGIYGYPKNKAWEIALQACQDFILSDSKYEMEIIFAVLDEHMREMGEGVMGKS